MRFWWMLATNDDEIMKRTLSKVFKDVKIEFGEENNVTERVAKIFREFADRMEKG